jgi:hypothetical protein
MLQYETVEKPTLKTIDKRLKLMHKFSDKIFEKPI